MGVIERWQADPAFNYPVLATWHIRSKKKRNQAEIVIKLTVPG